MRTLTYGVQTNKYSGPNIGYRALPNNVQAWAIYLYLINATGLYHWIVDDEDLADRPQSAAPDFTFRVATSRAPSSLRVRIPSIILWEILNVSFASLSNSLSLGASAIDLRGWAAKRMVDMSIEAKEALRASLQDPSSDQSCNVGTRPVWLTVSASLAVTVMAARAGGPSGASNAGSNRDPSVTVLLSHLPMQ